jgi:hypothetical protein
MIVKSETGEIEEIEEIIRLIERGNGGISKNCEIIYL